jgi:hypothetical protein
METITQARARIACDVLNESFQQKKILDSSFYLMLNEMGFELPFSVLVSICPDGQGTFFGHVIRQDGKVYRFDADLNHPHLTECSDVTDKFTSDIKTKRYKFWSQEQIAYNLFLELSKSHSSD